MILNAEQLCSCGRLKARQSMTCNTCQPSDAHSPGRPQTFTDDQILDAIEDGNETLDRLLATLNLKSKSTLMVRLRRMRDAGLVGIIERTRHEGFTIESLR